MKNNVSSLAINCMDSKTVNVTTMDKKSAQGNLEHNEAHSHKSVYQNLSISNFNNTKRASNTNESDLIRDHSQSIIAPSSKDVVKLFNNPKLKAKLFVLLALVLGVCLSYLFLGLNWKYFDYAMSLRVPKLSAMFIAATAIGSASLIFQTLSNNYIITPCLLGMNSLYLALHTLLVFIFGIGSFIITNKNLAFLCDLALMGSVSLLVYNYIFIKTKYNILYVLLIGTVLTTLFNSIQSTLVRAMDPNDYDALLTTLVASFSNVNSDVIFLSVLIIFLLTLAFFKHLKLLDVISLGKNNALSLGVDYDKSIKVLLLYVALLIAIATALVGPISFIGIIATNISRQLFKTYKHTYLIVATVLVTLLVLIAAQVIIERIFIYSVPVSVFITIGGGIYFLYLVLSLKKKAI